MDGLELKCARIRRGKSSAHMGRVIGQSEASWTKRERGVVQVSLKEVPLISKELDLDEREFVDIFFDGKLPFRSLSRASSTTDIVAEGSETINGKESNESRR